MMLHTSQTRAANSTRYGMFAANLVKHLSRRACASVGDVIKPLADTFLGIGPRGNIEQSLIGFGVLYDGRCFALHHEDDGALAFS